MKNNIDAGILTWRIILGVLMLIHGIYKLFNGIAFIKGLFVERGLPEILAYSVHIGETIAPLLIIIGYRTKISSVILALTMIVAVGLVYPDKIFALNQFGGWFIELNAFFFFGAIGLFFTGGGKYSVSTTSKWD